MSNNKYGGIFNVSILRIYLVLLAEFGGKGDYQENRPNPHSWCWVTRHTTPVLDFHVPATMG